MLFKQYRTPAFIAKAINVYVHILGVVIPFIYGVHHILYETLSAGILSLTASFVGAYRFYTLLKNKNDQYSYIVYFFLLGIALIIISYFHGYRGLIFLFPYTACLFFLLPFKIASIKAVGFSVCCVLAAYFTVELVTLLRISSALMITIGISAYYAYVSKYEKNTLEKEAHNDPLTGIRNRRYFKKWLEELSQQSPEKYEQVTLFYIDIDNFKHLNDNYSHAAGDELLKRFTRRIVNIIRDDDLIRDNAAIDNFARLAGDEFILAITCLPNTTTAQTIASRIIEKTSRPFQLRNTKYYISISIGIAFAKQGLMTNKLLHHADLAMYQAKRLGKNTFHLFDSGSSEKSERKKDIEEIIINGLKEHHFYLAFMPIYSIKNKEPSVAGYEALLRCHKEYISPEKLKEIIPTAEDSEIIKKLDLWVIETTFKHIASLKIPLHKQWIAINISSAELSDASFIRSITSLVDLYNITPQDIHLEITETKLAPYNQYTIDQMLQLNSIGFKLALDDYGTGFTGLAQLLNFPGHYIKIDRSFTSAIGQPDNKEEKMIALMLSMAKVCQLNVIVEGVETQQQLDYLTFLGCESVQGYYLSKPVEWQDVAENNTMRPLHG